MWNRHVPTCIPAPSMHDALQAQPRSSARAITFLSATDTIAQLVGGVNNQSACLGTMLALSTPPPLLGIGYGGLVHPNKKLSEETIEIGQINCIQNLEASTVSKPPQHVRPFLALTRVQWNQAAQIHGRIHSYSDHSRGSQISGTVYGRRTLGIGRYSHLHIVISTDVYGWH